ncbi:hypothetical protein QE152_g7872 [Popillia japonica]|uniref:Uncharacterized protein n=1 Tax=Popillia japonica TaxID=7064 RepID=A0AAW1MDM0_POPJA
MGRIKKTLRISNLKAHYWTDPKIVLSWIKSSPKTWKTFVASRVGEIHELSEAASWLHVSTNHNPADVLSRGSPISILKNNELWWSGPEWLQQKNFEWPTATSVEEAEVTERKGMVVAICSQTKAFDLFERACQAKNKVIGSLTPSELNTSMITLIKIAQASSFAKEIHQLTQNGKLDNDSRLLSLNPFIDNEGILRVSGRLNRSNIAYQHKHQSLLPTKHWLTELIIQNEHATHLHSGTQLTMAAIRLNFLKAESFKAGGMLRII